MKTIELTHINPDRSLLEKAVSQVNSEFSEKFKNFVGVSYQGKRVFLSYKEEQDLFYLGMIYEYLFCQRYGMNRNLTSN